MEVHQYLQFDLRIPDVMKKIRTPIHLQKSDTNLLPHCPHNYLGCMQCHRMSWKASPISEIVSNETETQLHCNIWSQHRQRGIGPLSLSLSLRLWNVERGNSRTSHPSNIQNSASYRLVADSSVLTSSRLIRVLLKLMPVSNQLERVTSGLHTVSGLSSWMNKRYARVYTILPSLRGLGRPRLIACACSGFTFHIRNKV